MQFIENGLASNIEYIYSGANKKDAKIVDHSMMEIIRIILQTNGKSIVID
jgi:hypothetical protein